MQSTRVVAASCLIVGAVTGLIVACSNILTPEQSMSDPPAQGTLPGTVRGRIVTGANRTPVDGAIVKIVGIAEGGTAQSDKAGMFLLPTVPSGDRTVLSVALLGFVDGVKPLAVIPQIENYVEISLAPVGVVQRANADATIDVNDGQGARVVFTAGSLVRPDKSDAKGEVIIRLTQFDPSDPGLFDAFPGDFMARRKDGSMAMLRTVMPMDITVTQGDVVLNLRPGATATVEFPIPTTSRHVAPKEIDIWSLDVSTGLWIEESKAQRTGDIYSAKITHLSTWNADVASDVACIRGLALSNGTPVPGASVTSVGMYTDIRNRGRATTRADGTFVMDVKVSDQSVVSVAAPGASSAPLTVNAPTTMGTMLNPASCSDIGIICVNPAAGPIYCGPNCTTACGTNQICVMGTASATMKTVPVCQACMAGTKACGSTCTDTATDSKNCGMCGNVCGARQQCAMGVCTCTVAGETNCGGVCTDLNSDAKNCGTCGKMCGLAEVCKAGTCQANCEMAGNPNIKRCTDPMMMTPDYCADISQDRANCGACKYAGAIAVCGANQICLNSKCIKCNEGGQPPDRCNNTCVNKAEDRSNCGSCGFGCGPSQICKGSMCLPCIGANSDRCDNECVDLKSTAEHCGTCTNDCTNSGSADSICQASRCILCMAPTSKRCGQDCVDTQSNRTNCGSCGKTCSDALKERCTGGACVACAGATPDLCAKTNQCVNLKTDQRNCGTCGFDCGTKMCVAGVCM